MTQNTPDSLAEIDLWRLWEAIWTDRWLAAFITGLFCLGGVSYAILAQEWFEAEVVLAPSEKKSIGGALAQFSDLARLTGLEVPGAGEQEPVAILQSRDFSKEFIEDQNLLSVILSVSGDDASKLDIRDAVQIFVSTVRSVVEDKKTGLVILRVRWKDPDTAAIWANLLVKRLNERMRERALTDSERNVSFLQREMSSTSVISLQQSLGRVLEGELQKLMLARGNEEFAFKVIDSAVPPKGPIQPKRGLIVVLSFLAGLFLAFFIIFVKTFSRVRVRRE